MADLSRRIPRRTVIKGVGLAGLAAALGPAIPPFVRDVAGEPGAAAADSVSATTPAASLLPRVPRRPLGRTGATVPILNFGAVRMDERLDPKLAEALRFGVNYIDTAYAYHDGANEKAIGNTLQKVAKREDVWITTKAHEAYADPAELRRQLQASLERLQTDHVDAFFLHGLEEASQLTEVARDEAEKLKREGKIRFFGWSSCFAAGPELLERSVRLGGIDAVMVGYNFKLMPPRDAETGKPLELAGAEKAAFDQRAATWGDQMQRALDAAHKAGIGLIAMKSQASSISFAERTVKWEDAHYTKGQAVLKAVWEDERIASICSSMRSLEILKENIAAALDRQRLGATQWRSLERYARACQGQICDRCDHICGAYLPAEMRVGTVLRSLMYHQTYGDPELAHATFRSLPRAAWCCDGVDFSAASRACPNGIDIGCWMGRACELLA